MGSSQTGEVSLDGWTLEPMAAGSPDGTVKATKPAASPAAQSTGGSFATTTDLHTALDETLGRGKWKATGDYRTMQRENQLRRMGAETVAPGHISPHSRGNSAAPGAHDIVIANVTPQQGIRLLQQIPGVKSVRFEGAHGEEGAHFHVNMADTTGWREGPVPQEDDIDRVQTKKADGWTLEPAPVTTTDIGWRLGPKPSPKPKTTADKTPGFPGKVLSEPKDSPYRQRRIAAAEQIQQGLDEFGDPGGDPFTGLENKAKGAVRAGMGAFGLLTSPFQAEIDAGPGKLLARATQNAPEHIHTPTPHLRAGGHDISDAPGHGAVRERPTLGQKVGGFLGEGWGDYSLRFPETFVGDAAAQVALTAIGGKEAMTPADLAKGYEKGEEISHELPPPRPPRRGEPPTATRDWSDLTPDEKRAEAREKSRAKRNQKLGIATPDEVRRMQDQHPSPFTHPDPVEGEVDPAEQSVYHGSPHEFDRFDLGKIGTGEGAQVYGHGLYFAGRKGVARYYRDELSRRNNVFTRGDETVSTDKLVDHLTAAMDRAWDGYGGTHDGREDAKEIARALIDQDNFSEHENWVRYDSGWGEGRQEAYLSAMREARTWNAKASKGKLYTVDIPDDHEYLDLDKPLSEQSDHVKAALEKAGYKPPLRDVPTSGGKTLDALLGDVPHAERIALVFARSAIKAAKGRVAEGLAAFRNSSSQALSEAARQASESVARRIEALGIDRFDITKEPTDPTGSDIYKHVGKDRYDNAAEPGTPDAQASAHLRKHGIAGNRYLDQGSRAAGDGSHNYVLFDDSRAEIRSVEQRATDGEVDPTEGKVGGGEYTPEETRAVEKELTGKNIGEVVEFVAKRNPNRAMGKIAEHVGMAIERLQKAGVEFRVRIVNPSDSDASHMSNALGLQGASTVGGKPAVMIRYRGSKWASGHGLQDNTLLHEAIHGVTNMALHVGRLPQNAGTELARTVASLDRLTNHIIKVFNERHATGDVPFHIGVVANSDELLAYGFTHEPFQKWLETIPYASGNAWTGFVDTVRKMLGVPARQHTALSALIRHGEAMFDELNADEVAQGFPDVTREAVNKRDGGASTHGKFGNIAPREPGQHQMYGEEHPFWGPRDTAGGKAPMPKAGGGGKGGGDKGGFGGSGYGPGDIPVPGSIEHHGPVIGNEPDPVVQLDNGLYRIGGAATADKIEVLDFLKKVVPKLLNPAKWEEISHHIEQQIVDPGYQVPEEYREFMDVLKPWTDEAREAVNYLRSRRDPNLDPFLPEMGWMARRVKGHTMAWDEAVAEGPKPKETDIVNDRLRQIIPSKRNISPNTTSLNSRSAGWMVPDWRTGELVFSREKPPEGIPGTRIATMDEVEANTDIRYYRNPLINTIDEVLRLRRVLRAVQVLDHAKKTLKDRGMAFHYSWKDPNGVERGPGKYNLPDKFVPITTVPQLEGWAFHPEIAEVFKDYYPPEGTELDNWLNQINRMMIGTLFITPIPHILNVAAHAWTGRGWDWFDIPGMAKGDLAAVPRAYVNGVTTALQAIHEVWTKGPMYRDMLREGAGLMYGDTQVRNFLNVMLEKAGHEITHDPQNFKEFAREFDLKSMGLNAPKDLIRLLYDKSNKSMWMVNDMFLMQRVLELQKKGADVRTAIRETEKDIPNYRIPSRVMGSRGMSQFLRNRNVLVFGRYKYGQWKALSGMFRDFVDKSSSMEERVDALGKILVTGLTMMAIFPAMDMALKTVTGNEDARVRRPGPFAILDAVAQYTSGEKDWAVAGSSLASLSPLTMEAVQAWENRDFFGRPLVNATTPLGVGVQLFEMASEPIYPLKTAEEFSKPGGGTRAVGRMFGLDIPPPGTKQTAAYYRARDRVAAARREAKDPLQQAIMKGAAKLTGSSEEEPTAPPLEGDEGERPGWTLGPIK